ncbi:MAG: prepilin-type N-terminal cleavage/methylation domain-containing protein [Ruminococcaceae bacterium]|nr:prepilin-type N-terminal cleavage/methylation domain-containing protein [Oscillospiraceae bacterium]
MKNKKGFTLAEVMIVVAIIVILSGATTIGIVSMLRNAQNTAANLEAENGDNFEASAREKVNKIGGTAGSMQQQTETLQGGTEASASNSNGTTKQTETSDPTASSTLNESLANHNKKIEEMLDNLKKAGCPDDKITVTRDKNGVITGVKVDWGGNSQPQGNNDGNNNNNNNNSNTGPAEVGKIKIPGGYVQGGFGITQVTQQGDGYKFDITHYGTDVTINIKPAGGNKYTFNITDGVQWLLDGMPTYKNNGWNEFGGGKTVTITSADLTWLENKFGFTWN